ncbi:MAG: hydroxyacylglutathione hydrolase [Candidatus Polarisedimenticolaceae bacterium]|nr:hydroxyacylglutathione hydrolase [Candidatus Polarisedimenticolaceae bacterium]
MFDITPIPAFADNYIWLLKSGQSPQVAVVDPGDAAPVLERLQSESLSLDAILITHHHHDHTGGIGRLKAAFPHARVYGPAGETIPGVTDPLAEGDEVQLPGCSEPLRVFEIPGHTAGHIAYAGDGLLFCGDTLFAGGCGRVFDGTMAQMAASLQRIAQLPQETLLYCAHEYTEDNLGFAYLVEPENQAIEERQQATRVMRSHGRPSVPSLLSLELETNPFLRTQNPTVIVAAEAWAQKPLNGNVELFSALRSWKDRDYD